MSILFYNFSGEIHLPDQVRELEIVIGIPFFRQALTGEIISAQEAWRIGLVNEVVPAAELISRADAILKQIISNAPVAIRYSLEAVTKGLETSLDEGLALEASFFGLCAGTEDKKEGTSAFLEKRAPQFQGR